MRSDHLARRANKNMHVVVAGVLSALVAEIAQPQPTGNTSADVMWSVLAGFAAAMVVGTAVKAFRPTMKNEWRIAVSVVVTGSLFFARVPGPFGVETILCFTVLVALGVFGYVKKPARRRRWRTRTKRRLRIGAAVVALGFAFATMLSLSTVNQMRTVLADSATLASDGAADLSQLEVERGTNKLRQSAAKLDEYATVNGTLGGRLMQLIPVVGHQRQYADAVVKQVRDLTARAVSLVQTVPVEVLSVRRGVLDAIRLGTLDQPVTDMVVVAENVKKTVANKSPWVMTGLTGSFDSVAAAATKYAGSFDSIQQFVRNADWLTGTSETRTVVVNVVSPAGVSGAGGVPVATGVMTLKNGVISLTFDPRRDPDPRGEARQVLSQTIDLPRAANTAWSLYSAALGVNVSGIVQMDIRALADLVSLVGNMRVDNAGTQVRLTPANAYELMAKGLSPKAVASAVATKMTTMDPLSLTQLAKTWSPAVANGNMKLWTTDWSAMELVRKMKATGEMGDPQSIADVGVFTTDALRGGADGANPTMAAAGKGWTMNRRVDYSASVATDGSVNSKVTVTLNNRGSTAHEVTTQMFTLLQCKATQDGKDALMVAGRQSAWVVHSVQTTIAAKGSTLVEFSCTGSTKEQGVGLETPRVHGQVTANGDTWVVSVKGPKTEYALTDVVNQNTWRVLAAK